MKWRRTLLGAALLSLFGAGAVIWRHVGMPAQADAARKDLPAAEARQGEFLVISQCRGELVADRSTLVTAPLNVPDLRIAWQAPGGSAVKKGDLILRFDASGAKRQLQEKEASLQQAKAQLDESIAAARIAEQQVQLEVATLTTQAERARLEVSRSEILSVLQAEERKIDHELAKEKLRVKQADASVVRVQSQSKIATFRTNMAKLEAEVALTNRRIEQMEVKAPSAGVISYLMNYSQGWMNAKPFQVGDNVWPGSSIAEIPDLQSLQMKAKVEETERGRLVAGMAVRMRVDPFPERTFDGSLLRISPLTEQNFEWPPTRNFRAFAGIADAEGRLRPAMNGRMDIVVDRIPNAISVPSKAVFAREGKPVVLVLEAGKLRLAPVEILARNADEVAVKGIAAGAKVALEDELKDREKRGKG